MVLTSLLVAFRLTSSLDDLRSVFFWRAVVAEALGTLLLIFMACGSSISWDDPNKVPKSDYNSIIQTSFCSGLNVATIVNGIGHVSGAHINPAVTCAFLVTRRITFARAILYIAAQCCGAILGAMILKSIIPYQRWGLLGSTIVNKEMTEEGAFGVEFMVTFVIVFIAFATCDSKRTDLKGSAALAIGLSAIMCQLFAVPLTGSSMNPARSFGPAVAMNTWDHHWVYWLGPISGGVVAGLLYEYIFAVNATYNRTKQCVLANKYDSEDFPVPDQTINIKYNIDENEEPQIVNPLDRESVL